MTERPPDADATPFLQKEAGRRRIPWILLTSAVVILGGLVTVIALGSRFGSDPNLVASAVIDRSVPDFVLPRLGEEGSLSLADMRGEIVVVNFWASWCAACRAEHDDLLLAASRYRDRGVRFVGIVFQDRPSSARAMLDELGWGYEYAMDPDSRAAIAFGVRGIPETYFVDRQGIIVSKISGESDIRMLSSALDSLLDPAAGPLAPDELGP